MVTNIETWEWRCVDNVTNRRQPEHLRASSTDDANCFFSVMRDSIGHNFTTKQVNFGFRKACAEFTKCLDPDLPFYYHTSSHTRFYEGPTCMPNFSEPDSTVKRKSERTPRREQPAAFVTWHATMLMRGSQTVRAQFHNIPVELPPLPSCSVHVVEHNWS